MLKPNVKMAIIILTTIVAISLILYFYTKETNLKTPVSGAGGEYIPGEVEQLAMALTEHTKNHPSAGAAVDHDHEDYENHYHEDYEDQADEDHVHPASMPIWRAQIDPDVNQPVGAYDDHPTDSDGNLTSASFNDMRDSFRESNLMLIGNNSTDIHFINGGLLMKGFEDHVKNPLSTAIATNAEYIGTSSTGLRGDVATNAGKITTNADDIKDITKESSGGKIYELGRRITKNKANISGNESDITDTRDHFKKALIATRNYYARAGDMTRTSTEFPGHLGWDHGHWNAQNRALLYLDLNM